MPSIQCHLCRVFRFAIPMLLSLTSGCVTVTGETDGRIRYAGGESGLSCRGEVDQGRHQCTVDTRRLWERIRGSDTTQLQETGP